jgi:hypothetical protein
MKIFPTKLSAFIGQAWGSEARVKLPNGPTYEEIHLKTNITDPANIEKIIVQDGSEEIFALTGAEVRMLEAYKGLHAQAGIYIIPFSDISARTLEGTRMTGLVTNGKNYNINVIVRLKSGVGGGAPEIKGTAYTSAAQPYRLFTPRTVVQTMQAAVIGDNEYTSLPSAPNIHIRRMHFKTDKIIELVIKRDRSLVLEAESDDVELMAKRFKRAPQDGYFHFDPQVSGFNAKGLFPTAHKSELKFIAKTNAIPTNSVIPIIVESIEQVAQLPKAQ